MWTSCLTTWFLLTAVKTASSSLVKTTHGPIEGTTLTLFNGKNVDEFLSVPYAAPPIGQNRFAPPQPLAPWNGTLETKKIPMTCPQGVTESTRKTSWYVSDTAEDEDCLYMNIWQPKETSEKMPIMIWIHGGGFIAGSSNMPEYNGSILASENQVIVAVISYRLAMFGFLYMNDSEIHGNAGLQDQIQAIKWIRDNAEAFGGDPESITLFGQSAGAISINAHMFNKEVRPLFRNAIMESASLNCPVISVAPSEAYEVTIMLCKQVQCPVDDCLDCLRSKTFQELQNTITQMFLNGHIVYALVKNGIEVPEDISNAPQNVPDHEKKDVLMGNVPRELGFIADEFYPGKNMTEDLTVTPEEMSTTLKYVLHLEDERLQDVLIHEYKSFDGSYNSSNVRLEILSAISDFIILCPELNFRQEWLSESNSMYYYYFSHRPSQPFRYPVPEWLGTIHGDDIAFVFGTPLNPERGYTEDDMKLSKTIMTFWGNFVRTGNPNGNSSDSKGIYWPQLSPGNFTHLEFEQNTIETKSLLAERKCEFWDQIFPKLLSIQQQLDGNKN